MEATALPAVAEPTFTYAPGFAIIKGSNHLNLKVTFIMQKMLATALLLASPLSHASSVNEFTYLTIGYQKSNYEGLDFVRSDTLLTDESLTFNSDRSGTGFRISVGYQVNLWLGFEASFVRHGVPNFSISQTSVNEEGNEQIQKLLNGDHETLSLDVKAAFYFSFSDALFIRALAGGSAWKRKYAFVTDSATRADSIDDSGLSPIYGVGLGYSMGRSVSLMVDLEESEYEEVESSSIYFSLAVKF